MKKKEQEGMLKLMNELDRKTRRTLLIDKKAFRGFKCITKHKIIECAKEHYCNVYVQATSDFILFRDLDTGKVIDACNVDGYVGRIGYYNANDYNVLIVDKSLENLTPTDTYKYFHDYKDAAKSIMQWIRTGGVDNE